MTSPVAQARFAPEASFRFVSGDVCLDLVNTADWTGRGLERDRLTDYGRVLEWARGAGVIQAADEVRLRAAGEQHPHKTAAALETILDLRGLLHRMFVTAGGASIGMDDLAEFNALLAGVAPHSRLVREPTGRLTRGWAGFGESIHSVQWVVTWAAAELLASNELSQVRMCAGTDCGWLYVDRSRNGLRRWCEMEVCGTAAKNRRRSRRVL